MRVTHDLERRHINGMIEAISNCLGSKENRREKLKEVSSLKEFGQEEKQNMMIAKGKYYQERFSSIFS